MKKLLNRLLFRQNALLTERTIVNNKVCMVVWNTFETDARVTKEAETLIKSGKQVTVIAVHQPGRTKREEYFKGIHVIRVNRTVRKREHESKTIYVGQSMTNEPENKHSLKKRLRKKLSLIPKLIINFRFFTEALKQDAGIYHAHDLNTLIPVFIASRLRGARLVYDAHEVSTDRAGWSNKSFWELVESYLIKRADKVITTNITRADYFKETYNIPLPYVVKNVPPYENVAESNKLREEFSIAANEPVILYQGGIQKDRGLENMIKMMPLIQRGKLIFLGNGRLKPELISLVNKLELNDRIYFKEAVPNSELLSYTSSATIGLQLLINTCFNHYSACSNKLNEYMMAGLPVVASDLPEIRRTIHEFDTGILVNPEDISEIAAAVNRLISEEVLYARCKANTKKAAETNKWENEESTLREIYEL